MSQVYKLFNTVCQANKDQILRYLQPSLYQKQEVTPLWAGKQNMLDNENVPKCPRCNKSRQFELQIMPQIFDKIEELKLVDWETLVIYTCVNPACLPDFSKHEFYRQEFGYIQFTNDFANVRYGDDKQIQEQLKNKQGQEISKEEQEEILKEQQEIIDKLKKEQEAEANKKKNKKQKQKQRK